MAFSTSARGSPVRSARPLWKSSTLPALILMVLNLLLRSSPARSAALPSIIRNDSARFASARVRRVRAPSAKAPTTASTSRAPSCDTSRSGSAARAAVWRKSSNLPSSCARGSEVAHWVAGVEAMRRARWKAARSRPPRSSRSIMPKKSRAASGDMSSPSARSAAPNWASESMTGCGAKVLACAENTFSTSSRSRLIQNFSRQSESSSRSAWSSVIDVASSPDCC
mmetsp:Transcript_74502/g.199148  ORF Transcript_74502/g.199148 Transcript_74502/m.199148 type:complete len:225 (+) Transcript_74502:2949-3623(+)